MDRTEEEGGEADAAPTHVELPAEERAELATAFLDLMQQRFLSGEDAEHGMDYAAIDADAGLDEDFADLARRDAEDAYFDEDGG